jgi:hypothetical protein
MLLFDVEAMGLFPISEKTYRCTVYIPLYPLILNHEAFFSILNYKVVQSIYHGGHISQLMQTLDAGASLFQKRKRKTPIKL